jgi:hypothetical protein
LRLDDFPKESLSFEQDRLRTAGHDDAGRGPL